MEPSQEFDKYEYYSKAVQSPEEDAAFIRNTYIELRNTKPKILREDFCAAHALCCEWVKLGTDHQAIGVDLDPEPLDYGKTNYQPKLTSKERSRLEVIQDNVLTRNLPNADIVAALNFSYFGFKQRKELLNYFRNVYNSLNEGGILLFDCFGGAECLEPNEHESIYDEFSYFWDQDTFNPVNHHAKFHIHFKRKGEKKRLKVFSYDWRLWNLPELKDIAEDAGFSRCYTYWEGTDEDGDGNGIFTRSDVGDECESWVAYIAALK